MVPLRPYENYALFLLVFNEEVWAAILLSIIVVILVMAFADKVFLDSTNFVSNGGFVISRICADATNYKMPEQAYKRIFVLLWTFAAMFLILGFLACLMSKLSFRARFNPEQSIF